MARLHLSGGAVFVAENIGRTLLEVSVSDENGEPVRGLTAGAFSVTDLKVTNEKVQGAASLRVESLREDAPSFYSMLLANDVALAQASRTAFVGEHILSVSVARRHFAADQLNAPPRLVVDAQGFLVTKYSVS